jgi:hypothetical protein
MGIILKVSLRYSDISFSFCFCTASKTLIKIFPSFYTLFCPAHVSWVLFYYIFGDIFSMMFTLLKYCWWPLNTKFSGIYWQLAVHHKIWLGNCLAFNCLSDDPIISRFTLPQMIQLSAESRYLSICCGKWLLLCYTYK